MPECGEISPVEPLAHIFWEMTWVGYDESEIADQKQEIMDLADEANEMLTPNTYPLLSREHQMPTAQRSRKLPDLLGARCRSLAQLLSRSGRLSLL